MALQDPKEVPTELLGFPLKPEAHLLSVGTGSPAVPCTLPIVPPQDLHCAGTEGQLHPCLAKSAGL